MAAKAKDKAVSFLASLLPQPEAVPAYALA